jgi:toxin ParE1/3/4
MARRITWSPRALQDLEAIVEYIARDSQAYAGTVVKKIVNETRSLIRFPLSGRKVPEFGDENIREVIVYSYRVIYQLQDDNVLIASIVHGRRLLQ